MVQFDYLDEHVLVFKTKILTNSLNFQGISFNLEPYINTVLNSKNHSYMLRKDAETNPNYKQIIPYAILQYKNTVFSYCRGKQMDEKRLHGNYSIGVGGHVSIKDKTLLNTSYDEGLKRELDEEVKIDSNYSQQVVAFLNDNSNEVGKVHFGIIHIIKLEQPLVKPRESSIDDANFVSIDFLQSNISKYENWSKICIENIERLIK